MTYVEEGTTIVHLGAAADIAAAKQALGVSPTTKGTPGEIIGVELFFNKRLARTNISPAFAESRTSRAYTIMCAIDEAVSHMVLRYMATADPPVHADAFAGLRDVSLRLRGHSERRYQLLLSEAATSQLYSDVREFVGALDVLYESTESDAEVRHLLFEFELALRERLGTLA